MEGREVERAQVRCPVLHSLGGGKGIFEKKVEFGSKRSKGLEEMLQSGGGSVLVVRRRPSSREGPSEVEPDKFVTDPNSLVS